jgi:hypothetical protein
MSIPTIGRMQAAISGHMTKIGCGFLIGALLIWLAVSESNPWSSPSYVASLSEKMSDSELSVFQRDIGAIRSAVGTSASINVNQPWQSGALNVYVLASDKLLGWSSGGASYWPRQDVILIDKNAVWPYVTQSLYAGTNTLLTRQASNYDGLWRRFILLHELGHRTLHRNVDPTTLFDRQARRRYEDEADAFAFDHLARLLTTPNDPYGEITTRAGLFNRRNIERLPEPDRNAAIVASLIQEFSVNLLFSNAAVSTFDSGIAHKAFVERFKPRLGELLSKTTTKEGRTYVLISLAAVERVESAGRNIVAEIVSELPIVEARFGESDLEMKVLLSAATSEKGANPKLGTIRLPRSSLEGTETAKLKLAAASAIPEASSENSNIPANDPDPRARFVLPDVIEAMRAQRNDAPRDDWWPDHADAKQPTTEALVAQLDELYSDVLNDIIGRGWQSSCGIRRRVRDFPYLDVIIVCSDLFFAGRYNVESQKLSDVEELQGFHPETSRRSSVAPGSGITEIVDVRIDSERRVYFIEDTLSDQVHIRPHKLRVWLASRARPRLVGELDLLTDWIPSGSSIQDWFEISHPPVLTCQVPTEKTALCTEFLDSIFEVNLQTGKVGVLFYPAGVRRAWDMRGHYAFYARGGFRLFIARLE